MDIVKSHEYLFNKSATACLSTLGKDQSIQSSLVWYDYEDGFIRINTLTGSAKEINIRRTKTATVLIQDPENGDIYLSLRCAMEKIEHNGAIDHLDSLTQRSMGVENWYGDVEPADEPCKSRRVIIYLKPVRQYAANA